MVFHFLLHQFQDQARVGYDRIPRENPCREFRAITLTGFIKFGNGLEDNGRLNLRALRLRPVEVRFELGFYKNVTKDQ